MTPMKVKGGTTKQKINRQDTKHGIIDLPVARLRKQGFSEGGSVKKACMAAGGKAGGFKPFAKKEDGNPFAKKDFGGKPKFAAGGAVGRGDGCCVKGKTKGRMC